MLYEKYKSESEFRSDFIRPLLTKLGFLSIAELDGPQEFGKDFVFSEVTPFGFMRHYAVVAKHEKKINQPGKICETVLSQIKQAFSVSFILPGSKEEGSVSSVLVMNTGTVSSNAEKWLCAELNRERYGNNVHIFSGERLLQLYNQTAFNEQKELIPKIIGLISTIEMNLVVWNSMLKSLPDFRDARGCFTQALEAYLTLPFLTDIIPYKEVATLLQECRIINAINNRYIYGTVGVKPEVKEGDRNTLISLIEKAEGRSLKLKVTLSKCLANFSAIPK